MIRKISYAFSASIGSFASNRVPAGIIDNDYHEGFTTGLCGKIRFDNLSWHPRQGLVLQILCAKRTRTRILPASHLNPLRYSILAVLTQLMCDSLNRRIIVWFTSRWICHPRGVRSADGGRQIQHVHDPSLSHNVSRHSAAENMDWAWFM